MYNANGTIKQVKLRRSLELNRKKEAKAKVSLMTIALEIKYNFVWEKFINRYLYNTNISIRTKQSGRCTGTWFNFIVTLRRLLRITLGARALQI